MLLLLWVQRSMENRNNANQLFSFVYFVDNKEGENSNWSFSIIFISDRKLFWTNFYQFYLSKYFFYELIS